MRLIRGARIGMLLACVPIFGAGCASVSSRLNVLPSIARHRAESQYQAARRAEERGQLEKARESYGSLQKQSPHIAEYAHRMGVVCTQLQDYVTAGKYYDHARSLDPHNPALLADMGYSAYLQKDYSSAESLLDESVQLRPGEPRATNNLAMAIGYQGRYDECLAMFRRANSETQSQLNVAFIQSQRNEPETAIATYQRILSNEPGNKVAVSALQVLNAAHPRLHGAAPPINERVALADDSTLPLPVSIQPAWDHDSLAKTTETSPVRKDAVAMPPGPLLISSAADLPSPIAAFDSPVITPNDGRLGSTRGSTLSTSTESEFESPQRVNPPNELFNEAEDSPVVQQRVAPVDDLANIFDADDDAPELAGKDMDELTGLEWAQDDLARKKAIEARITDSSESSDCLHGFCAVALRDERRLAPALGDYSTEYQAQNYRFSTAEARDRFLIHPDWYVPAAGGLDVIEVKRGHAVAQGSLDFACWFRHRLHLFSSAENLAAFRATPREFCAGP